MILAPSSPRWRGQAFKMSGQMVFCRASGVGKMLPCRRLTVFLTTSVVERGEMAGIGETPTLKLKSLACQRCHGRKVRCSGDTPCANCQRSGHDCVHLNRNRQVRVSENYIKNLIAENKRLKAGQKEAGSQHDLEPRRSDIDRQGDTSTLDDNDAAGVQVQLDSPGQPWFVDIDLPHAPAPINEAADTAYATRFVAPGREFPGLAYSAQATKMLNYLGERPTLDFIEIRLLLSLFSFTLNRVYAS